ncbi:Asp-tRNA(Asn)/Glu-tRNA(Gln) amidotransferase subunit GatC [Achromobacter sp. GG226]|uniref:Asp-tRNA(Asn)/Glu-tRNA(Gln) amidotransferase subunit GatC n=1 Tax=Verticiella alkaliphila TaxID=2779529 RepID=UPI001C0BEED8|nr:Asp-tRNA(Asn)/Glu-tRNA(Gln) amidotransferase subunit GatC [Verticiella sp. GG226]MBU4612432.1 Asp-tRNA(Asn)/Glu-tRNA(Gln) amidotransferase subunit GatC [Verticiella sp. GG226]
MTLNQDDVVRMARLARIAVAPDARAEVLDDLNHVFALIEQLQAVDTTGIEPLAHPLSAIAEVELRLREDAVTETASPEQRAALMANAPAAHDGLFLVPKVIE